MLRHGVYRLQFRLYTRETTVIYLKSRANKNIPGLWDSCKVKWVIWHEDHMINMYHNVRSVATLCTESRVQHATLPVSLRNRAATRYGDDKIQRGKFVTDLHSEKLSVIVHSNDETCLRIFTNLTATCLLKLQEFGSFSSDVWTIIALGKGWSKGFIYKWARNSLALHVMDIRDKQVHSALVNLSGDRGSTVVKVLCCKSECRWFDPSWCHWNFSLT